MTPEAIEARIIESLSRANGNAVDRHNELHHGALTVLRAVYGIDSAQEVALRTTIESIRSKVGYMSASGECIEAIKGTLTAAHHDLEAGFVGSLAANTTADVLADFIKLSRTVLQESGDAAKNVAAVLTAAAFEDAIRRLAQLKGVEAEGKLAEVLTRLKDGGFVCGAQIGIAQSYLGFRNKALHAQWADVDRAGVESALAFTEQLILSRMV